MLKIIVLKILFFRKTGKLYGPIGVKHSSKIPERFESRTRK